MSMLSMCMSWKYITYDDTRLGAKLSTNGYAIDVFTIIYEGYLHAQYGIKPRTLQVQNAH